MKNILIVFLKDALKLVNLKYPDCTIEDEETFEEQLEIILQFLSLFENK